MSSNIYARGELEIDASAAGKWSGSWPSLTRGTPGELLISVLMYECADTEDDALSVHEDAHGTLHIEMHSDFRADPLVELLTALGRAGATGRVWFPEDGMWGYILTPDGVREAGGALLAPGDELLLLTIEMPGQDRHEALYAHDGEARDAMDRAVATHRGREHRTGHLSDAMAAVAAAGGSATCRPVKLCP